MQHIFIFRQAILGSKLITLCSCVFCRTHRHRMNLKGV